MTRDRARASRDSGGMSPAISRQASGAARTRQSEVLRLQGLAGNSAVTGRPALEVPDARPQVVQSHPAPGEQQAAATSGSDDFVKDWARSTLELLPRSQREKFESIEWGPLDFPGTTVAIKGLKADALDWYL